MISIWAPAGIPEVTEGDDLASLVLDACDRAGTPLETGDVVVVTSKVVSKAEGRVRPEELRDAAFAEETVRTVATRERAGGGATRIVESRLGIVGASAGIDASNAAPGTVLLLPIDPDASARALAEALGAATGGPIGVILSDTLGRAWRDGQTDVAIGAAGIRVFDELAGQVDAAGRPLRVTRPCLADELAAAADLVKGKTRRLPVAIVRGAAEMVGSLDLPGARSIARAAEDDLFRLGTDEAYAQGYADGYDEGTAEASGPDVEDDE